MPCGVRKWPRSSPQVEAVISQATPTLAAAAASALRTQRRAQTGSTGRGRKEAKEERKGLTVPSPKSPLCQLDNSLMDTKATSPWRKRGVNSQQKSTGALSLVTYLKRKYKRIEAQIKRRIVDFCAKETYLSCVLCTSGQGKRKYSPSLRAIVFLPSSPP